jgi:hypothetical protein
MRFSFLKEGFDSPGDYLFYFSLKENIMKKLIGLITIIFTISILTPTFAFSEEQSKAKKFWLQTKESVKEAGKDIKEGVKEAGKEIKDGSKDAGKQIGDKAKSEEKKGEGKVKKDVNDAKKEFSN